MNDMTQDKQHSRPNVPPLRVPGFNESWQRKTLGECFEMYSGNTPSRMNKEHFDGVINWITSGELKSHYIAETKEKISEEAAERNNLRMLPIGTFVIAIYGLEAVGVRATGSITTQISTISQACMAFLPKSEVANEFLYSWYMKHGNIIGLRYAQGTKQQNLSYDILDKFQISYPKGKEQEKLIHFVSIIDRRIAVQNKIIERLQSLMGGIAQRLTAQSPNRRIADCLECHSSTLQESQLSENGEYRVFGANGVCGFSKKPDIQGDSILIVKDGSGVGNVSFVSGEYSVIGTSNYLTAKKGYSLRYLYYCLMCFNFVPYKTGMAIPHIYFKDYGKAKIFCPTTDRQERIATALSKIESKIDIERSILLHLTSQKQYLLQQMFI